MISVKTFSFKLIEYRYPIIFSLVVWAIVILIASLNSIHAYLEAERLTAPIFSDWGVYRFASLDLLTGRNPMFTPFSYVPPHTVLLIAPLAIFTEAGGFIASGVLTLITALTLNAKLKGDHGSFILIGLSPFVLKNIFYGNLEWLPLLGMTLAPALGLIAVTAKPQSGIGAVLFYGIQLVRRKVSWRVLAPLALVLLFDLVLYGYPFTMSRNPLTCEQCSLSIFPYGIPMGLVLLFFAVKRNDAVLAFAASPLFSPYFGMHSLIGAFTVLAVRHRKIAMLIFMLGWWYVLIVAPSR